MKYRILKPVRFSGGKRLEPGQELAATDLGFPASQIPSLLEIGALEQMESEPLAADSPSPADSEGDFLLQLLNTATEAELTALPNVGKTTAHKLMKARPFESLEQAIAATSLKPEQWAEIEATAIAV